MNRNTGILRLAAMGAAALGTVLSLGGCPTESNSVTVELVNNTTLDVTPNLYASGKAATNAALFVDANLRQDFTDALFKELASGETRSLTLDCAAEARTIGSLGASAFNPATLTRSTSADEVFLTRGGDFNCGDRVRIVYSIVSGAFRVTVE